MANTDKEKAAEQVVDEVADDDEPDEWYELPNARQISRSGSPADGISKGQANLQHRLLRYATTKCTVILR